METWKPVRNFEGIYSVSSLGNVRREKAGPHTRPGKLLRPSPDKDGYNRYTLQDYTRQIRTIFYAHRLVFEAYYCPIPRGMQVNHKNGIKSDNRPQNLELMTPSQNTAHGFRVLLRKPPINPSPGMKNGRAKLSDDDVRKIRRMYEFGGISQQAIADKFGVNQTIVSGIVRRKYWSHVA